jgi:hypothetical protein
LRELRTAPNAVRLFAQYCMEAPEFFNPPPVAAPAAPAPTASSRRFSGSFTSKTSSADSAPSPAAEGPNPWVGRFKIVLRCEDIEQFGLPSFITSYNSKPVLIRNTGTLVRYATCYTH